MSIWVIGDIQGCYGTFSRLLEKIQFDPVADQLWLTGDLVNRGGQSLETLRLIYSLRSAVTSVLGNHDIHLLAEDYKYPQGGTSNKEFEAIFKAHDRENLIQWLNRRPLLFQDKASKHLLVHAGLLPRWKVREALKMAGEVESLLQSNSRAKYFAKVYAQHSSGLVPKLGTFRRMRLATSVFTRMRFANARGQLDLKSSGPPGSQKKGFKPWFEAKTRRKKKWTVLFGHWAALGLYQGNGVICLDSGCVWGGKLTAMRLEDRHIVQVKRKKSCLKYSA
ncbi:MAG: symmetrical bis(5'-nucleosyl)-tetraphosphatase [Xanthomonadales bacterium]|nr:symmetrical bis(5'-nucleosyl)-tetraphosphatase [Xanthomonadales bacterium]